MSAQPRAHRARRWIVRGLLGLVALVLVVIGAALAALHTDWGREVARRQVEAQLESVLVGGGRIGRLEGSPFGELVARDVVINGPDGAPAITVETLRLRVALTGLVSKQARLTRVAAEGLEVRLARDERGELMIGKLTRPGPKSGWSIEIPELRVDRGHVMYDPGGGAALVNLDALALRAELSAPADGPLRASARLSGRWRERAVPIELDGTVRSDEEALAIGRANVRAGGVVASAERVQITKAAPPHPYLPLPARRATYAGTVAVQAPAAAVARLLPGVQLPADLAARLTAEPEPGTPWTRLKLDAEVDRRPVTALVNADLEGRRVVGFVVTGDLDATKLSRGRLTGHGSAFASFDVAVVAGARLPVGSGLVHARGELEGLPESGARVALESTGERATAIVDADGRGARAHAVAELAFRGEAIELVRGTLTASTDDPRAASGGAAPVRGAIAIDLDARGALSPRPSLAVTGRVDGRRLRYGDVSIESVKLAIDARQLPARPLGRAELRARGLSRGTTYLSELAVTAADREDGKLAVAVRTRPRQHPWLVEADALVTPGETVAVDLVRHRVRAGSGVDWRGTTGRVTIGPDRVELRDLATRGEGGALAASGVLYRAGRRAGRRAGDLAARVDVRGFALDNIDASYRGTVDARVDLERTAGRLAGSAALSGRGVAVTADPTAFELDVKLDARQGRLALDAGGGAAGVGRARIVADVAAPRDVADAAGWRALRREAIRTGRLTLEGLDVARLAAIAGVAGPYAGRIDGDVRLDGGVVAGELTARDLAVPATRALGPIAARVQLAQPAPDRLEPAVTARVGDLGEIALAATVRVPARALDPAAWRRLGRGAIEGASVRAADVRFDPGVLERLGVASDLRGRVSLAAEVGAAVRDARLAVQLRELRGRPLAQPVAVDLAAAIDGDGATMKLAAAAGSGAQIVRLADVTGRLPVTMAQLQADPGVLMTAPLAITAKLPEVPARQLGAVVGRSDIVGGTVSGTIDVAGTLAAPTGRARIVAAGIAVPPGPRNRPIKRLERLAIDARWDGTTAVVEVAGTQPDGSLGVDATLRPDALDAATVRLRATRFDLAPVLAFLPGVAAGAAGRLDADLTVTSLDPKTAKLAGELHLAEARLPIAPAVGTLRSAKVDLVAGERELRLAVDGRLGGGTVKARGSVALSGAAPTGGTLTLALRDVSPIGAVEPEIDADVTAKLAKGDDRWIADVRVRNGSVRVPDGRGEALKPAGAPIDMVFVTGEGPPGRTVAAEEPPARPAIEARVTLEPTYVESKELRGVIRGRVTVTADAQAVGVQGVIEADRGDLDLFGRRYLVERAAVRFDGSTDPLLDVRITHDFPEVTTVTVVRGRLSAPQLEMTSDPGVYTQGQLLGFLLGGEPNGEPATGNPRDKVTSAGTSFLANRVGGYVRRALPIDLDVLRYEAATASESAAVTVGTWLTRDLFVAYRRRLDARPDENTGEAEAEYWLTRRLMLEGMLGDRGYSGLDLLWRRRY